MLDGVLNALRWHGDQHEALDNTESTYTSLIARRLGADLGQLEQVEPELAASILALLTSADTAILRRVMLAPETSYRLLWNPGGGEDEGLWCFLSDALEIELNRLSHARGRVPMASSGAAPRSRWSALGDLHVDDANAALVFQPAVAGLVVDADSPAAICVDSTLVDGGMRLKHYKDPATKEIVLRKLETAILALDAMDPAIAGFVRRFTLVANIVTDDENCRFSSGSMNQYIGRSVFWNAHLPSVDTEALAEALVHEAIHSFLYMHEVREPWFLSEASFSSGAVVDSPWTGSKLRLEPFLQACFVWFGLANFWSAARRGSPFHAQKLEARLATARQGFLNGPLLPKISGYLPHIAPQVLELVSAMQQDIVDS